VDSLSEGRLHVPDVQAMPIGAAAAAPDAGLPSVRLYIYYSNCQVNAICRKEKKRAFPRSGVDEDSASDAIAERWTGA